MYTLARIFGGIIGGLTLAWQGWQVALGEAQNFFFIPDVLLGIFLVVASLRNESPRAVAGLLWAYGYTTGVFATATFGGLLMGTYDFGAATTSVGLVPSICFSVLLAQQRSAKTHAV
ncbi:MAG: hypothetical protein SFY70_02235 [Bacteroidia bacterium]|nr:hypothetical protein [Bacteroidia bacterium]